MSENSSIKDTAGRAIAIVGRGAWLYLGIFGVGALVVSLLVHVLPLDSVVYLFKQPLGQLLLGAFLRILALLVVIGVPYVISRRRGTVSGFAELRQGLGVLPKFKSSFVGLLLLCFLGYYITTLVFSSLATLLPWYDSTQVQNVGFQGIRTPIEMILAFVALVIIPPIAEELLFRGYYFGALRRDGNSFVVAMLATSLLFGFFHQQWNVGVDTFTLSLFLCYLREKTGSIWASMGLHAIKNGVAYFFLFICPLIGPCREVFLRLNF